MGLLTDAAVASFGGLFLLAALGPRRLRTVVVLGRPRPVPVHVPCGRPIEAIAADAHRLGLRFRYPPAGASFTRIEARRRAYDGVLAEACRALDVPHLLGVLPPGVELDRERERVETALEWAGFQPTLLP